MATQPNPWSSHEDFVILEACLPCQREAQLNGQCDKMAEYLNRGIGTHNRGELVRRRLWGLATSYEGGPGHLLQDGRTQRDDSVPATFTEEWMLGLAIGSATERKGVTEAAWLAGMLGRTVPWVEAQLARIDPRRNIEGFGF